MNRLAEIAARKVEIRSLLQGDSQVNLQEVEAELRSLEAEEAEIRKRQEIAAGIQAGAVQARTVATTAHTPEQRVADKHDTPEYRQAFMDYVTRGVKSDALELRVDATTALSDIGAVIPTTILNRIVEKMEDVGRIWSRVTKTSVQGGMAIPTSSAKPTATWVAAGSLSDKQKKSAASAGTITFSYYKLQVRVAVELVAATVALPVFEATVANNIAEAIVKALDTAILKGDGTGEPLGIASDTSVPAAQVVEVSLADFGKYATWTKLLGKVPRAYRSRVQIVMNDADWNTHIVGMVDSNGQPIARMNYGLDGTMQERLLGREVIPVDDLGSIDAASAGDVVAILAPLADYYVNSNMALSYRRYLDESTDEWISKATLIADGKLADPNGVVLVKLKA